MSFFLLLFFIVIPLIEIYLFITVGQFIGVAATLLIVILTAIVGTYLLRTQGIATIRKVQEALQQGIIPTDALLEGIFILVGGALLLTPGFFTDTIGFLCLLPYSRQYLVRWSKRYFQTISSTTKTRSPSRSIFEGECRRDDD